MTMPLSRHYFTHPWKPRPADRRECDPFAQWPLNAARVRESPSIDPAAAMAREFTLSGRAIIAFENGKQRRREEYKPTLCMADGEDAYQNGARWIAFV
jgi:hypothetical protein